MTVHDSVRRRFLADDRAGTDTRQVLTDLVRSETPLATDDEVEALVDALWAELVGLGPLEPLLRDDEVSDVLVNGPGEVWVERLGQLERTGVMLNADELAVVVERAFRREGPGVDRSRPIGDARLDGGARISVVLPPAAVDGPVIAVRRFAAKPVPLDGFAPGSVVNWLTDAIAERANVVVFGATGAGKTTLLNALGAVIDPSHRVVTIEEAAELRLPLPHVVRLECRRSNAEGTGAIELRSLVRAALRLRPDRIVVGEVRGPEALDMIWALASGHDGSLSTCHARSATEALARLETFVMMADAALPLAAVKAQIRSAIDVVVGVGRDGARRRVTSIHRVHRGSDGGRLVPVLIDGQWFRTSETAS